MSNLPGEIRPSQEEGEIVKPSIKLLVVEDEEMLARMMRIFYAGIENLTSAFCDNSLEAIELMKQAEAQGEPFSRIITDHGLKDKPDGGFDVAGAAIELAHRPDVIMLTTNADIIRGENPSGRLKERGVDVIVEKSTTINRAMIVHMATKPIDQLGQLLGPQK